MATHRKIDDFGEKIGGARKDMWQGVLASSSGIDGIPRSEWAEAVKKANIWPQPDWKQIVENGWNPSLVYLMKLSYDAIPKTPPPNLRAEKEEQFLRAYVDLTSAIRNVFNLSGPPVTSPEAFHQMRDSIRAALSYDAYAIAPTRLRRALFSHARYKAEKHVEETGWPNNKPWSRLFRVVPVNQEWFVVKPGNIIAAGPFPSHDKAVATADSLWEQAQAQAKTTRTTLTRPLRKDVVRNGPDVRNGRNVGPEDFVHTFGFRGVEFGLWANQADRQQNLNQAFDALHDLASILGLPPSGVSLNGTLGLAFGARGQGAAAAHYEPARKVINLTRTNGAGCLAHEWGHALDNFLGMQEGRGALSHGSELNTSPAGRLMKVAAKTQLSPDAFAARYQKGLEKAKALYDSPEYNDKAKIWRWMVRVRAEVDRVRMAGGITVESDFFAAAKKQGEYWKRPTELFARAFEASIEDACKDHRIDSPYLVQGTQGEAAPMLRSFEDESNLAFRSMYPAGDERKAIAAAVAALAGDIRPLIHEVAPPAPAEEMAVKPEPVEEEVSFHHEEPASMARETEPSQEYEQELLFAM
jgi:hypothetical protein